MKRVTPVGAAPGCPHFTVVHVRETKLTQSARPPYGFP